VTKQYSRISSVAC